MQEKPDVNDREPARAEPMLSVTLSGSPQTRAMVLTVAMIAGGVAAVCAAICLVVVVVWLSGAFAGSMILFLIALVCGGIWVLREMRGTGPGRLSFEDPEVNSLTIVMFGAFVLSLVGSAMRAGPEINQHVDQFLVCIVSFMISMVTFALVMMSGFMAMRLYRWNLSRCEYPLMSSQSEPSAEK
jgi:hypothetical protein